jgi:hypothetical protein
MLPPCSFTMMSWLIDRSSPVPSPERLVVKNGLNILSSVAPNPALARDSGGLLIGSCPSSPSAHYWRMANDQPFTIEILDLGRGEPVVVDRVTGATVYMEEAKRTAVTCFP